MAMMMTAVAGVSALCYTTHRSGRRAGIAEVRDRDKVMNFERAMRADVGNNISLTPYGAFDYSGGQAMSCQHAIVYCPLHKGGLVPCGFKGRENECKLRTAGCRRIPSIEECVHIYETAAKCSAIRKRCVRNMVKNAVARCGMRMEDSSELMTSTILDGLKDRMITEGYEPSSIAATFGAFQAISSRKLRRAYEEEQAERPMFDVPEVELKQKEVKTLTNEQKLAIEEWMTDLRRSNRKSDKAKYLALFFTRYFAMRPGDVNRLTMDNIVKVQEGLAIQYIPHKTEKVCSRKVDYWISPKLWLMVKDILAERKSGEFIIPRNEKCAAREKTHGELVGAHSRMWADINRKYRSFGITSYNCVYRNRGWRLSEAFEHGGMQEEFALSQHSGKIAMRHYINTAYRPAC